MNSKVFQWIVGLLLLWPVLSFADGAVLFVYDQQNEQHREYVAQGEAMLRQQLPGVRVLQQTQDGIPDWGGDERERRLVISVGSEAAANSARFGLPTLNTLITQRSFNALEENYHSARTAIYFEQAISRQLELVRVALPQRSDLVILTSDEQSYMKHVIAQAKSYGLNLRFIKVDGEADIGALFDDGVLTEETLLLIPDPVVVNRNTVKPLVLGSYRKGIPLIGFSQALVKAGALMAVHSPLPILQEQMIRSAQRFFETGVLPAPGSADDYEVAVNYQLARALKVDLPTEGELKDAIQGVSR